MLQVGGLYYNRIGQYQVLEIRNGKVLYQYTVSKEYVKDGDARILERIHNSVTHESSRFNIEKVKWSTLVRFKELLRQRGCLISIHVHPDNLPKLQREYLAATGQELQDNTPNLHVKPYYFRNSIAIQLQITTHRCSSSELPAGFSWTETNGSWSATCTAFGWELLRDGFHIGSNAGSASVK